MNPFVKRMECQRQPRSQMRHDTKLAGVALAIGGLVCSASIVSSGGAAADPASPTFNQDVAPIIFGKCASCHRTNQSAPMPLTSFAEVRPWVRAIEKKVADREMPPWFADSRFGKFRNDSSLTAAEIQTIVAWVRGGAREGVAPAPPLPAFADGWNHPSGRPPDIVLEMPTDVSVPAEGMLPTLGMYSKLPPELSEEDHFVEAAQLVPGNTSVVHHSSLSMGFLPQGVTLGSARAWPGGPVLQGVPIVTDVAQVNRSVPRGATQAERFSPGGTSHFVFFFPGNNGFAQFAPGVGKRIPHDNYVEWNVHYSPTGRPASDRHRAGLWLQRVPPTHEMVTMRVGDFHIVNGREIVIPSGVATNPGHAAFVDILSSCAGKPCVVTKSLIPAIPPRAENWTVTAMTAFQDAVTIYLGYPHGHLRLQDMTYVLTYPEGREEVILSVPRYDFNWQLRYEWADPIRVPAGSTIKVIGHYDNSARNKWNPNPEKTVQWSEQSWDEMFNGFVDLSVDKFDFRTESTNPSPDVSPPQTPLVTVVGCVARTPTDGRMLTNASRPVVSAIVHADAGEIEAAASAGKGSAVYQLIGSADFESGDELLSRSQRRLFTRPDVANATGELRPGRRVAVKALLIDSATGQTLNLLSVQPIAGTCQ